MTRAMDELPLTFAQSRRYYGSRRYSEPSPFLNALKGMETPTLYQLMFGAPAPATRQVASPPSFLPGQRVRHPQHGFGIVVRASEEFITVMFPGSVGMLTLSAQSASLEEA